MVFVAKPMGVWRGDTSHQPIVTPMCNAMFALKTGNAVIFAPHPKADKARCPHRGLHGCRQEPAAPTTWSDYQNGSIETTQELMKVVVWWSRPAAAQW